MTIILPILQPFKRSITASGARSKPSYTVSLLCNKFISLMKIKDDSYFEPI
ncbi:unnamed protein product [Brugia timori]|uniref:Uncharacterized protein n=1 Tax=Brugia timori TaxID=42155 RepID=A0A3P7SNZ6_9BILA|nr:unnamed protein product [Brugia timori]